MNLERSSLSFFDGFIGESLLLHPCQRLLGGKGNEELAASRGNFVFPFVPWDTLEKAVLAFPNHQVLAGFLVKDSRSFFPDARDLAGYGEEVTRVGIRQPPTPR